MFSAKKNNKVREAAKMRRFLILNWVRGVGQLLGLGNGRRSVAVYRHSPRHLR